MRQGDFFVVFCKNLFYNKFNGYAAYLRRGNNERKSKCDILF